MRFAWICALALAAASAAQGQGQAQSPYCQHLLDRIQDLKTSLTGLTNLVSSEDYTLAECSLDPNLPASEEQLYGCLDYAGVQGVWRDAETRIIYVVVSKEFVRQLAAQRGQDQAAVQRAFALAEQARSKIYYGGVIQSLQGEIRSWEDAYRTECTGTREDVPFDGCLLGVCP
jgi:hypothetical protein